MKINYQFPASRAAGASFGAVLLGLAFIVTVAVALGMPFQWASLAGAGLLFGVNTVTYSWPVAGVTAPTAVQAKTHSMLIATITGDGAATTFAVTHNWALSAAQIAGGFPVVILSSLLAAGNTAAALKTTSATNATTFTCTAFTGAGLQVTLLRPWTGIA